MADLMRQLQAAPIASSANYMRNAASKASLGIMLEKAKAGLLDVSAPMRSSMLTNLRDMVKGKAAADPEMWSSVRSCVNAIVDELWTDIEEEVERRLESTLLKQHESNQLSGPRGNGLGWYYCIRRLFLHHYLPHNRSIFGKLKDPIFLLIFICTLIPLHGVRVAFMLAIFVMICCPGPPDKFQLISFILQFKGTQFVSSGIIASVMGAAEYFYCYSFNKDNLLHCLDKSSPSSANPWGLVVDYLGSIVLVWMAHCGLRKSKQHVEYLGRRNVPDEEAGSARSHRGGRRLQQLLMYDFICFVLSLSLLVAFTVKTCGWDLQSPQFVANLFWCRVFYSFLSLPFMLLLLPLLRTVLTHCAPTGYNTHGACVPFELPALGSISNSGPDPAGQPSDMLSQEARFSLGLEDGKARVIAQSISNISQQLPSKTSPIQTTLAALDGEKLRSGQSSPRKVPWTQQKKPDDKHVNTSSSKGFCCLSGKSATRD